MARIKYCYGEIELDFVQPMDNAPFATAYPTIKGYRYDGFSRLVRCPISGERKLLPVERKIKYKSNPSKHECDARCMFAKGSPMTQALNHNTKRGG